MEKITEDCFVDSYIIIIESARIKIESVNPDALHDWDHHQAVLNAVVLLTQREQLEASIDLCALKIASAWHDFEKAGLKKEEIEEVISFLDAPEDLTEKVFQIITEHNYTGKPQSLEAKLLWDADKLEYLNPKRLVKRGKELQEGKISIHRYWETIEIWQNRIGEIYQKLHFNSSKEIFTDKLNRLIELSKDSPILQDFLRGSLFRT